MEIGQSVCTSFFCFFISVDIIIISSESEDSDHDGAVPGTNTPPPS